MGASIGLFASYVASLTRPDSKTPAKVFAIEPIPSVALQIRPRENLTVVQVAVLPENSIPESGRVDLNVYNNSELSSFRTINGSVDNSLWSDHLSGAQLKEVISVAATTLETLILDHKMPIVDFLKIDAQGEDLAVLESAGAMMGRIQAVVIEVPYTREASLYESEISLSDAIEKVRAWGFIPVRITPNGGGECNLFLINQNQDLADYFRLETDLGLLKAPTLKIGPHIPFSEFPWLLRGMISMKNTLLKRLYQSK